MIREKMHCHTTFSQQPQIKPNLFLLAPSFFYFWLIESKISFPTLCVDFPIRNSFIHEHPLFDLFQ